MIKGKYVNLRIVEVDDADFILSLRCDENKSKYLHKTDNDIDKQKDYIRKTLKKQNEWYFIIERLTGEKIGTYRIYDVREESFCIGSWLMKNGVTALEMMESDYLTRKFGFNKLNFDKLHFDVRKGNKKSYVTILCWVQKKQERLLKIICLYAIKKIV